MSRHPRDRRRRKPDSGTPPPTRSIGVPPISHGAQRKESPFPSREGVGVRQSAITVACNNLAQAYKAFSNHPITPSLPHPIICATRRYATHSQAAAARHRLRESNPSAIVRMHECPKCHGIHLIFLPQIC